MKVMSIVRMEAGSPAWPLRAMRRNDAREVSSQVRNIRTRLSLRTKATIEKVNPDMMR